MKTLVEHINEQLLMELRSSKKKDTLPTLKNLNPGDKFWFRSKNYNECLTVKELVCDDKELKIHATDGGEYGFFPDIYDIVEGGFDYPYVIFVTKGDSKNYIVLSINEEYGDLINKYKYK